jgi:serine/threonine protein kinase
MLTVHCDYHRDLKLENFLFSDTGADSELKMIDFGLSKVSVMLPCLVVVSALRRKKCCCYCVLDYYQL